MLERSFFIYRTTLREFEEGWKSRLQNEVDSRPLTQDEINVRRDREKLMRLGNDPVDVDEFGEVATKALHAKVRPRRPALGIVIAAQHAADDGTRVGCVALFSGPLDTRYFVSDTELPWMSCYRL